MSINIDKELLETALGFSDEEEWHYQLMCALTDPDVTNYVYETASHTVPEKVYLFASDDMDVGGVYGHQHINFPCTFRALGDSIPTVTLQTSEKLTWSDATHFGAAYVKDSDVAAVTGARSLWFKRLKYLRETAPTRYKTIFTVANESIYTTITVTGKAMIGLSVTKCAHGIGLVLDDGVNKHILTSMVVGAGYSGAGPSTDQGYNNSFAYFPLKPVAGHAWKFWFTTGAYFVADVITAYAEVFDNLPAWW